jgi:hypothetical protein
MEPSMSPAMPQETPALRAASLDSVPSRLHTGSPFAPVFVESVGV